MAGHGGELVPLAASHSELRQSAAARMAGSAGPGRAPAGTSRHARPRQRRKRALGCSARRPAPAAGCPTRVSRLTALSGPGGSWTSVVNVWHQRGHQTLIQTASLPGAARPRYQGSIADPDGEGDAASATPRAS